MKKFIIIIFILIASNAVFSQDFVDRIEDTPNCGLDFKNYYKCLNSDSTFHFIEINLASFPSQFEKKFFINLVYQNKAIVSIDSDLSKEKINVKSNRNNSWEFIKKNLEGIICRTYNANQNFTQIDKQNWLEKNTKK